METKKFTLGEFIDNLEKNGLPQAFGGLFVDEDTEDFLEIHLPSDVNLSDFPIKKACALGQGYINTGIHPFDNNGYDILPYEICQFITNMNDREHAPFSAIAGQLRYQFGHRLNDVFEGIVVDYNVR